MKTIKICLTAMLIAFSTATFASPISFLIGNHSDGGLYDGSTNPYGLRLDDTDQTFTVGDNLTGSFVGASLSLTFDPANLAAGAILTGSIIDNATGVFWDVSYSMSDLSAAPDGGFIAQTGSGMLTEQGGSGSFNFVPAAAGAGAFIFDNDGHRLSGDPGTGWVGRGWFDGTGANDFLITGTQEMAPVPLPGAIWMMGAGLLSLFGVSRRK